MPGELGLIGGVIGGIGGAIGGAVTAAQQRKDQARTQRDVRAGVQVGTAETARSIGNIMTSKEYLTGANFIRSMFGIQGSAADDVMRQVNGEFNPRDINAATGPGSISGTTRTAYKSLGGIDAGVLMSENLRAVAGQVPTFGGLDPLSQDFVKNLRVAQAARGLEGQAAGAGEAAGLASFRVQLQSQMLPQLMALAENPASLRAKYETGNLQRDVYRAGAGAVAYGQANPNLLFSPSVLGEAMKGGASGFALGSSIGGGFGGGAFGLDQLFAPSAPQGGVGGRNFRYGQG